MKHLFIFFSFITISLLSSAQKKPLNHDVYDGWQSIGERKISKDGKWILYSINLQEGDDTLVIQSADNKTKKIIDRGFGAKFSENNKFVIFRIKPLYNEIREAKIKKKKIDENPKDSLGILELANMKLKIIPAVKNFMLPEKQNYLVYHLEKKPDDTPKSIPDNKKPVDSLQKQVDSLMIQIESTRNKKNRKSKVENLSRLLMELNLLKTPAKIPVPALNASSGTDIVFLNLENGVQEIYSDIMEYQFSKEGDFLLMKKSRLNNIAKSKPMVL